MVINPSRYPEGLPTVILEAGSARRAMISTAMGGAGEVIENGYSGIIIAHCSESEISSAIEELYRDPEKRVSMGNHLYENVINNFNWDTIMDSLLTSSYFTEPVQRITENK
jgi:glycosyltransferase involved in cell wall biosynthesis